MSDEDALLRAICADPADDTARLVFADYLQEHGGSVGAAWAHVIRGQIEQAWVADGEIAAATAARVRLLNVPFWHARWFARLVPVDYSRLTCDEWARGFPTAVAGDAHVVLARWPDLVARVPFERLTVRAATDEAVEELAARPELARVRDLRLETAWGTEPLTDRTFLALAACPHLPGLEELSGHSFALTDAGASALIDSPHLGTLRSFLGYAHTQHRYRLTVTEGLRDRLRERFAAFGLY